MDICVCVYVCMCVCVCTCVSVYLCAHMPACVVVHTYMCECYIKMLILYFLKGKVSSLKFIFFVGWPLDIFESDILTTFIEMPFLMEKWIWLLSSVKVNFLAGLMLPRKKLLFSGVKESLPFCDLEGVWTVLEIWINVKSDLILQLEFYQTVAVLGFSL